MTVKELIDNLTEKMKTEGPDTPVIIHNSWRDSSGEKYACYNSIKQIVTSPPDSTNKKIIYIS